MRLHLTFILLAAASVLLLAACSDLPWSGPSEQGYMDKTSSWVDFMSLTTNGSQLIGTLDETALSSDGTSTSAVHDSLSGTENGNQLTLQVAGLFGGVNLQGHFDGSNLLIAVPQTTGGLTEETLTPATSTDYNNAVKNLQQQASNAAQAQAQAEAQAQAQAAANQKSDQDAQALASAYSQVGQDINTLNDDPYINDALSETTQAKTALDKVGQYEQKVAAEGPDSTGQCSYDASNATYYESNVQYFQQAVTRNDQTGVTNQVSSFSSDATALQNAESAYQNDEAANPGYQTSVQGIPTPDQVSAKIASTQNLQPIAQRNINSFVATVNQYYAQAQQVAAQAEAIC